MNLDIGCKTLSLASSAFNSASSEIYKLSQYNLSDCMRIQALCIILSSLILITALNASSSISTSLIRYNVSQSIVNSLKYVNVTANGLNYTILYYNNAPYLVVNDSSSYSFVFNTSTIFSVIKNYTLHQSISSINFTSLAANLQQFQDSSASSYNDCLTETGLNAGSTCTLSNNCQSCQSTPVCNKALYESGGFAEANGQYVTKYATQGGVTLTNPFAQGILELSVNRTQLINNYTAFYSSIQKINASNAAAYLPILVNSIDNISSITHDLYTNPLFPELSNVTNSELSTCITYVPQYTAPWYCQMSGFCENLNYNFSMLSAIQLQLAKISTIPITNAQILGVATSVQHNTLQTVYPYVARERYAALQNKTSAEIASYSLLLNQSNSLLLKTSNSSLSLSVSALKSYYTYMQDNYLSLNISSLAHNFSIDLSKAQSAYMQANATYNSMLNLSAQNDKLLLLAQLNGMQESSLANLSFQELSLDNQMQTHVSNTIYADRQLSLINNLAKSEYQSSKTLFSLNGISRAIGAPFAMLILPMISSDYGNNVASAPLAAALLAIIISIVILLAVLLWHRSLAKKGKLRASARTHSNWMKLFAIIGLALLLYIMLAYIASSQASSGIRGDSFKSIISSSPSIAIITNGTSQGITACANTLNQTLKGKHIDRISIVNGFCTGVIAGNLSDCLENYAKQNEPVIYFSSAQNNSITMYSYFGTLMDVEGSPAFMFRCYPASILS